MIDGAPALIGEILQTLDQPWTVHGQDLGLSCGADRQRGKLRSDTTSVEYLEDRPQALSPLDVCGIVMLEEMLIEEQAGS